MHVHRYGNVVLQQPDRWQSRSLPLPRTNKCSKAKRINPRKVMNTIASPIRDTAARSEKIGEKPVSPAPDGCLSDKML